MSSSFWSTLALVVGSVASVLYIAEFVGIKDWLSKMKTMSRLKFYGFILSLILLAYGLYAKFAGQEIAPNNVQTHVRDWLDDFGVTSQKVDRSDFNFTYLTTVSERRILIGEPKAHDHYLVIETVFNLEELKPALERLSTERREIFWKTVALSLLTANHQYRISESDSWININIARWLPITSGLTPNAFFEGVEDVSRGLALADIAVSLAVSNGLTRPLPTPDKAASPH